MTVKNIRRGLKDKYFDIPFSHVIKNNILSLISKGPKEQTKNSTEL